MPHGKGTFKWDDGQEYEGSFKLGIKWGQGRMTYANGDLYDGEWNEDERHGHGKHVWANGEQFEGNWIRDKPDLGGETPQMTMNYPDGSVYQGFTENGKRHGRG